MTAPMIKHISTGLDSEHFPMRHGVENRRPDQSRLVVARGMGFTISTGRTISVKYAVRAHPPSRHGGTAGRFNISQIQIVVKPAIPDRDRRLRLTAICSVYLKMNQAANLIINSLFCPEPDCNGSGKHYFGPHAVKHERFGKRFGDPVNRLPPRAVHGRDHLGRLLV